MKSQKPSARSNRHLRSIFKPALMVLPLGLTILALAGCGRHVQQGQIFIATQGGQNVKLGAVEILVFDEATINTFIKQRQSEMVQQRDKLQHDADAAKARLEGLDQPYRKAKAEYLHFQKLYDDQAEKIRQETEKANGLGNNMATATANLKDCYDQISQADQRIAGMMEDARKRAAIAQEEMTRQEIFNRTNSDPTILQAQDTKRRYQAALNELLTKTNEIGKLVLEQRTILDAEKQKLAGMETELSEKQKSAKSAEDAYQAEERQLNMANQALADLSPARILFDSLPQPAARAVSDADGTFRLESPAGGRFAVFAHAQRTVSETENYYWLVWSNKKDALLLNNANIFGSTSSDQVLRTSAGSK